MPENPPLELAAGGPKHAPARRARVLVVDDEADACEACCLALADEDCDASAATSGRRALELLASQDFDLVVTDVTMPEMSGLELCRRIGELESRLPVIMLTGRTEADVIIEALRAGATDFLRKPVDARSLSVAVARALKQRPTATAPESAAREPGKDPARPGPGPILGRSPAMKRVHQMVADLSGSLVSVLLQGESGTGKDVIAHAIHDRSQVQGGPFVAVNCAAMPAGLLESCLFGHARGAFTDAKQASRGLFLAANGGTLLLDEIGELPLEMQPKLLRALQERTVRAVGGRQETPFDCRLITATNRDLEQEVQNKRFREDLYYRLDVVRITVPPLRERRGDILALAQHFLSKFSNSAGRSLGRQVESVLLTYSWPGNVRELENCIERAVTMAKGSELSVEDLPSKILRSEPALDATSPGVEPASILPLEALEHRHVLKALELANGNKTIAAEMLGINRRTLQRRLKKLDISDAVPEPSQEEP
jgi:two-component system response regulator HydG